MDSTFREALSTLSYGLYVLTVQAEDFPLGTVVSWVSQVSFEPPLIMVAVRNNRMAHDLIKKQKAFALFTLGGDDAKLMSLYKVPDPKKRLAGAKITIGKTGAPLMDQGLSFLECSLVETLTPGDHTLFIGRVENAGRLRAGRPTASTEYGKVYLGER